MDHPEDLAFDIRLRKAIVKGTPGIGESIFLFYVLWRLLKEQGHKRVLFALEQEIVYFTRGQVFSMNCPPVLQYSFWKNDLWCLFDSKDQTNPDILGNYKYDLCNFIVGTSPRSGLYNDYKKSRNCRFWFMPTWSTDEIQAIDFAHPAFAETWRSRFEIIGGVPRHVFSPSITSPLQWLDGDDYSWDTEAITLDGGQPDGARPRLENGTQNRAYEVRTAIL
jgi:hypothetical protein